jgi:hypothetical protein
VKTPAKAIHNAKAAGDDYEQDAPLGANAKALTQMRAQTALMRQTLLQQSRQTELMRETRDACRVIADMQTQMRTEGDERWVATTGHRDAHLTMLAKQLAFAGPPPKVHDEKTEKAVKAHARRQEYNKKWYKEASDMKKAKALALSRCPPKDGGAMWDIWGSSGTTRPSILGSNSASSSSDSDGPMVSKAKTEARAEALAKPTAAGTDPYDGVEEALAALPKGG